VSTTPEKLPREIQLLERAAAFLAEIQGMDEVRKIRDKAEALRLYHRKIDKASRATIVAAEIKVRAERRMGELLAKMPKAKNQHGCRLQRATGTQTLADLGIEKTESHRCQAIAAIPQKEFEEVIDKAKKSGQAPTSNELKLKGRSALVLKLVAAIEEEGLPKTDEEKRAFFAKHGGSNGSLQSAKVHLGLAKPPRVKTLKERDQKAYRGAILGSGNGNGNGHRGGVIVNPPVADDDANWLESLPIRGRMENPKGFDSDALIVKECGPLLEQIKAKILSLLGHRSVAGMSTVHRALHRVFDLPNPKLWQVCEKCGGKGRRGHLACRPCRGGGYVIPNFTRGASL
jgi:hypothetical protein